MPERYETVIGLEVHCQLATASKAFSPDSAAFTAEPNEHVDPVSLGHPGTLPVLNGRAVEFAAAIGLATHCRVAPESVMARKHYFYPDLPKGYQISQYDRPICEGGWVDVRLGDAVRRICLTRIHLEEDAGRSIHDADPSATLLDYNRCGVPLVEIVTEPDLASPAEAAAFLRTIRQIVRYLGISDGNMEEGSLRCDANVSIRPAGSGRLGTKTEIKNLNSFRHVERAVEYEVARQRDLLDRGERVVQETRLWDDAAGVTRPMRSKEEAHDYRYFPDPDLPPVRIRPDRLEAIRASMPESAASRRERYVSDLGLPPYDADLLTEERETAEYFERALSFFEPPLAAPAKALSNVVMTQGLRRVGEFGGSFAAFPVDPERLAGLVRLRLDDAVSSTAAVALFDAMLDVGDAPADIAARLGLLQVSDASALEPVVDAVLEAHPAQVSQYRSGKTGVAGFLVGQVMKAFPGSADPRLVRRLVEDRLHSE